HDGQHPHQSFADDHVDRADDERLKLVHIPHRPAHQVAGALALEVAEALRLELLIDAGAEIADEFLRDAVHEIAADRAERFAEQAGRISFWLLIGMIALVGVGKAVVSDTLDPDLFWHLRVADQLHRDGVGPLVDELSFQSIRTPWTPYSWLAELGMKWAWDHL